MRMSLVRPVEMPSAQYAVFVQCGSIGNAATPAGRKPPVDRLSNYRQAALTRVRV
ncbi:hypothetical protein PPN31114_01492 [Pandoraea pneumonica]|uniref:Uncharacterized protein n=1 Tax=Pandoraea pneumonica TaxID=2508299 RepID=A0A5E4TIM0_9BURK|nr:hypothetical protein PPN31114_01492 [Pandoraea pneumonica]